MELVLIGTEPTTETKEEPTQKNSDNSALVLALVTVFALIGLALVVAGVAFMLLIMRKKYTLRE